MKPKSPKSRGPFVTIQATAFSSSLSQVLIDRMKAVMIALAKVLWTN